MVIWRWSGSGGLRLGGFLRARLDGHVMAHRATGHGAQYCVMMRIVASHGSNNGAFETAGACRSSERRRKHQGNSGCRNPS
jgi:hypothetical protein